MDRLSVFPKPSQGVVAFTLRVRCEARAPKNDESGRESDRRANEAGGKKWREGDRKAMKCNEAGGKKCDRKAMKCGRRRVFAVMAWPLLLNRSVIDLVLIF